MIVFIPDFLKQQIFLLILVMVLNCITGNSCIYQIQENEQFSHLCRQGSSRIARNFPGLLFFLPNPLYELFYAATPVTAFELMEEIIVTFWLSKWRTNVKGLYWILKAEKKAQYE